MIFLFLKGKTVENKKAGLSQSGPADKLKEKGFLYGIIIISIAGGHFYDGKTEWANSDGDS